MTLSALTETPLSNEEALNLSVTLAFTSVSDKATSTLLAFFVNCSFLAISSTALIASQSIKAPSLGVNAITIPSEARSSSFVSVLRAAKLFFIREVTFTDSSILFIFVLAVMRSSARSSFCDLEAEWKAVCASKNSSLAACNFLLKNLFLPNAV